MSSAQIALSGSSVMSKPEALQKDHHQNDQFVLRYWQQSYEGDGDYGEFESCRIEDHGWDLKTTG